MYISITRYCSNSSHYFLTKDQADREKFHHHRKELSQRHIEQDWGRRVKGRGGVKQEGRRKRERREWAGGHLHRRVNIVHEQTER